jgi:hypothetical protein
MTQHAKRLTLRRESLHPLTAVKLAQVQGATQLPSGCGSCSCGMTCTQGACPIDDYPW